MALNQQNATLELTLNQQRILLQSLLLCHAAYLKLVKHAEDGEAKETAQFLMDLAQDQLKQLGGEEFMAEFETIATTLAEADLDTIKRIFPSSDTSAIEDAETAEMISTTGTEKKEDEPTPEERSLVKRLRALGL